MAREFGSAPDGSDWPRAKRGMRPDMYIGLGTLLIIIILLIIFVL